MTDRFKRKFWSERVDRESGDIIYEVKEIPQNGSSDLELQNSSFIVFQGARAKEDCDLFMKALTLATEAEQRKPHPKCDSACMYLCESGAELLKEENEQLRKERDELVKELEIYKGEDYDRQMSEDN